jgi:hypothetical protein
VREERRFHLDAVHEDDACPRIGRHVQGVIRLPIQLRPVAELLVDRNAALLQRVKGSGARPVGAVRRRVAAFFLNNVARLGFQRRLLTPRIAIDQGGE